MKLTRLNGKTFSTHQKTNDKGVYWVGYHLWAAGMVRKKAGSKNRWVAEVTYPGSKNKVAGYGKTRDAAAVSALMEAGFFAKDEIRKQLTQPDSGFVKLIFNICGPND